MLHKMKQANLRKRFSGMMLSNDGIKIGHEDMLGLIDSFFEFANNNCKEEFAKLAASVKALDKCSLIANAWHSISFSS